MPNFRWKRILITGAAGRLGSQLRQGLRGLAEVIRVTDLRDLGPAAEREELVLADLTDFEAVKKLMQDVDVVLHFGAVMVQAPWEQVLPINLVGTYQIYEAARQAGVSRIIYASSSHAVGMYRCDEVLDADSAPRPDTPYGLSKAFGENIARMYFDKYGIEAACLRIGSCFPEVTDKRMLATWLSHADLVQLCIRCLEAPTLGYAVVYGVSANSRLWWDNRKVAFLGYMPQDNAESHASNIVLSDVPGDSGPTAHLQGGRYVQMPDNKPG